MGRIDFNEVQFPVGQGGFHMGWLRYHGFPLDIDPFVGTPPFAWAYDCGSDQTSALNTQIQSIAGARIDMLFLSHLDNDHVSGVDKLLLAASDVEEVVLPYLGDTEWALHLASGASSGALSGTFADLAADPAGWFGARGVRRITYVDSDGDEDEGGVAPDPVEPSVEGGAGPDLEPLKRKWSRTSPAPAAPAAIAPSAAEIIRVPKGAVASIAASGGNLNWVLSPYAFRPSAAMLAAFNAELAKRFAPGLSAKDYADAARTKTGREDLRACYDLVWKTHNLHSMALYAGPAAPPGDKLRCTAWQGNFLRRVIQPGWLSTGDFDLSVKKRREKFLRYYDCYAGMVGQLMLPHHGSDHSFDASVLAKFPDLIFAIAAVGTNGHGHPGPCVQAAVAAAPGPSFVRVDEYETSLYQIQGRVEG
jgi:hypothetical protein